MESDIENSLKNLPESYKPPIQMLFPNEEIDIYKGIFILKQNDQEMSFEGEIKFTWFPEIRTRFKGKGIGSQAASYNHHKEVSIIIDGLVFGEGRLYFRNIKFETNDYIIEGYCHKATLGDYTVPVTEVQFALPNFRELFFGESVKHTIGKDTFFDRGRVTFEDTEYTIVIDKISNFAELKKELKARGGYLITYAGRITSKKGTILLAELDRYLYCFSHFLYLLTGSRTAPLFLFGKHNEETIWRDYSRHNIDQYKMVNSWSEYQNIKDVSILWQSFYQLWKDTNDRDFLQRVLHWYIEANSGRSFIEGSVIFAQNALELIYNWLLIEKKKLIIGNDAENISAANKFRLLLAQLQCSSTIPDTFDDLLAIEDIIDGPDIFVKIRNALVHGQEKKRIGLMSIAPTAKYEALKLAMLYIELSLLYIVNYQGAFFNTAKQSNEIVPWSKNPTL